MIRRITAAAAITVLALTVPAEHALGSIIGSGRGGSYGQFYLVSGSGHSCSYTVSEKLFTDDNMNAELSQGSTWFSATWTPGHSHPWEDAYWITGWHDEPSTICDGRLLPGTRGLHGQSLTLGFRVSTRIPVIAGMHAHGTGRLGFDIWFTADPAEVTAAAMEHDPRTWEVLVQPGHWHVFGDHPGWHRLYISALPVSHGAVSFCGLSLTRIIERAGVPGSLYWQEIGAGGETPAGSFTVDWYALSVAGEHPVAWSSLGRR